MSDRRKTLDDILLNSEQDGLERLWDETEAADDLGPLPRGLYKCCIRGGEVTSSTRSTPGYRLTFEVREGEHEGRRIWHTVWMSPKAMHLAKRELAKVGITAMRQMDDSLRPGMLADVRVVVRKNDDGVEFNRVADFKVTGIEPPDPFAPTDDAGDGGLSQL